MKAQTASESEIMEAFFAGCNVYETNFEPETIQRLETKAQELASGMAVGDEVGRKKLADAFIAGCQEVGLAGWTKAKIAEAKIEAQLYAANVAGISVKEKAYSEAMAALDEISDDGSGVIEELRLRAEHIRCGVLTAEDVATV